MHHLVRTEDGICRADSQASGAADASALVDKGDLLGLGLEPGGGIAAHRLEFDAE